MAGTLLRTDEELTDIYERNKNTVFRICFSYMKNYPDAEDAAQDTFVKLVRYAPGFESPEHEKAWLIRAASNVCKNMLRSPNRKTEDIDEHRELYSREKAEDDVLNAVFQLPEKYKTPVYLYYYEGYSSVEIAKILKKPQSTVRTYLGKAKNILREKLKEEQEV